MRPRISLLCVALFFLPTAASTTAPLEAQQLNEICAVGVSQRTYTHYSNGSWEWIVYAKDGTVASRNKDDVGYPASAGSPKHFEDVCNNGHWFRNVAQYY